MALNIDLEAPFELAKRRVDKVRTIAELLEDMPSREKQLVAAMRFFSSLHNEVSLLDTEGQALLGVELCHSISRINTAMTVLNNSLYQASTYYGPPVPTALSLLAKLQTK